MIDLDKLAQPDVVEELNIETIYQQLVNDFKILYPNYSAVLESDPVVKLLELYAYRESLIRARINNAAKSQLLAFATGADLDHLAAFYGVKRQDDELDKRLRMRTQFQIAAMAGNGTTERYRAKAMEAHSDVIDAAVTSPKNGEVLVAIWTDEKSEFSQNEILQEVQAFFDNDNTITLGVSLTVSLALPKVINVTAKVYRESSAPLNICEILQNNLGDAINNYAQLGRDISLAFLHSQLFIKNNISRIEIIEPTNDVILSANEFAKAGEIKIIDGGVQW